MKVYTEAELANFEQASARIKQAMDDIEDYDLLASTMAAHVQRMICNKAGNLTKEAEELLNEFYAALSKKVKSVTYLTKAWAV